MKALRHYSVIIAAVATIAATPADAGSKIARQVRADGKASFERFPPEYIVQPFVYRGFSIAPELEVATQYIDNVFYQENGGTSDLVIETTPSLEIIKSHRDHKITLNASARDHRFFDQTSENKTTYNASLKLDLQARKSLKIPLGIVTSRDFVTRATPSNSRFTTEPVDFTTTTMFGGLDYTFNRLNVTLIGEYETRSFDDGISQTTGDPVIFSNKDRTSTGLSLIGTYNIFSKRNRPAEHAVFAGISVAKEEFETFIDSTTGQDTSDLRSNKNVSILAGLKTRYKDIIIGDIGFGYLYYDYESDQAEAIESYDIAADLSYLITPKLTLNFDAGREVNQDNDFVQGFIRTDIMLGAEYEFQHDLYGSISAEYRDYDFLSSSREDDLWGADIGLRYIHSPKFESEFGLGLQTRDSNNAGSGFDQVIMRYGLTGKL